MRGNRVPKLVWPLANALAAVLLVWPAMSKGSNIGPHCKIHIVSTYIFNIRSIPNSSCDMHIIMIFDYEVLHVTNIFVQGSITRSCFWDSPHLVVSVYFRSSF